VRVTALVAVLAACAVPEDMAPGTGREPARETPAPAAPTIRCEAHDDLGGLEWLPADLRLAVVIDLDAPELPAAIQRLQDGVRATSGLPVVASLGLGQLGLQLGILRPQLQALGIAPRELVLLHDRAGAVVWVLRARCDLEALQAAMTTAWSLGVRTVSGGAVAEARSGGLTGGASGPTFAHDVAFLSGDRIALVPPGTAVALRRWLEAPAPAVDPGARPGVSPGERLGEIAAAPIRGILAGRALQTGESTGTTALTRTLRATAEALEIDGQAPSSGL
jgi:hypothetical protein